MRVFISSTFRDMHAERDHLATAVFPELRERVEQLGLEFFDLGLRWGVSEEAAADQSIMRICRAEMARCQAVSPSQLKFNPFFVGLCLHD